MIQYTIRRLLLAIPVIFGILIVTFALSRMIPGEPCKAMLGEKATAQVCEIFTKQYGLDKPIPVQFAIFMGKMFQGDFGESIRFSRPVTLILIERLPTTIELGSFALLIACVIGIPAGILSALKRNSPLDVTVMVISNIGVSMPVYWLGLMLAYFFALVLKDTFLWLPPTGRLTAGISSIPFYELWNLAIYTESFGHYLLQFFSNFLVFNSLITGDWAVLWDSYQAFDPAGHGLRDDTHGDYCPDDPIFHVGSLEAGLHPYCQGKRITKESGHIETCPAQCDAADHYHHRS